MRAGYKGIGFCLFLVLGIAQPASSGTPQAVSPGAPKGQGTSTFLKLLEPIAPQQMTDKDAGKKEETERVHSTLGELLKDPKNEALKAVKVIGTQKRLKIDKTPFTRVRWTEVALEIGGETSKVGHSSAEPIVLKEPVENPLESSFVQKAESIEAGTPIEAKGDVDSLLAAARTLIIRAQKKGLIGDPLRIKNFQDPFLRGNTYGKTPEKTSNLVTSQSPLKNTASQGIGQGGVAGSMEREKKGGRETRTGHLLQDAANPDSYGSFLSERGSPASSRKQDAFSRSPSSLNPHGDSSRNLGESFRYQQSSPSGLKGGNPRTPGLGWTPGTSTQEREGKGRERNGREGHGFSSFPVSGTLSTESSRSQPLEEGKRASTGQKITALQNTQPQQQGKPSPLLGERGEEGQRQRSLGAEALRSNTVPETRQEGRESLHSRLGNRLDQRGGIFPLLGGGGEEGHQQTSLNAEALRPSAAPETMQTGREGLQGHLGHHLDERVQEEGSATRQKTEDLETRKAEEDDSGEPLQPCSSSSSSEEDEDTDGEEDRAQIGAKTFPSGRKETGKGLEDFLDHEGKEVKERAVLSDRKASKKTKQDALPVIRVEYDYRSCQPRIDWSLNQVILQAKALTFRDNERVSETDCLDTNKRFAIQKDYSHGDCHDQVDRTDHPQSPQDFGFAYATYRPYWLNEASEREYLKEPQRDENHPFALQEEGGQCVYAVDVDAKQAQSQSELVYYNRFKQRVVVESCRLSVFGKTTPITATTRRCGLVHQFDKNRSIQQHRLIYTVDGIEREALPCHDTGEWLDHQFDTTVCKPVVDEATKRQQPFAKRYVVTDKGKVYISEPEPYGDQVPLLMDEAVCHHEPYHHNFESGQSFVNVRWYYRPSAKFRICFFG